MALVRTHFKPLADGEKISLVDILGGGGVYPGRTFWVKPAADADYAKFFADHNVVEDGTNSVYNTVDAAISACLAGRGDVIYVAPGHTETVTASSIAHDVAGVMVVGLGHGESRPTFTYGAAAATITVSADNCGWTNCRFIANFADVASAFTLSTAKSFKLEGCTFLDTSSILNFLSILVTDATNNRADGLTVVGNFVETLAATQNAFISILANQDRIRIEGNDVTKAATNDAGQFITLSSKVITGARIRNNTLVIVGATGATVGIFLTGSATTCTGIVAYNLVASLDTTSELIATPGTGLKYFENYYTGTADASGKLWPVVDAA